MATKIMKVSRVRKTIAKKTRPTKQASARKLPARHPKRGAAKALRPRQSEASSENPPVRKVKKPSLEAAPAVAAITEPTLYDANDIIDAEEFHELSRAMGIFTWSTWDVGVRPFEERRLDFLCAYPPCSPMSRSGGRLQRQDDGTYAQGKPEHRLARFLSDTWDHGAMNELLSRFGLKMRNAAGHREYLLELDSLKDVAKRRNVRLRVLHGGVDVEPANMDAAKAEYLDRQEKQQAARDVRAARARMQEELSTLDREGKSEA